MAVYEVSSATSSGTTGAAALEFVAGTNAPASILEFGIFLTAATASTYILGRPGNTPAGGTPQTATLPANLPSGGGASVGGFVLSGWTTAPTVPAAGHTLRSIALPAAIGNGIVWTWEPDQLVVSPTRSSGLILWNAATNSTVRFYLRWRE